MKIRCKYNKINQIQDQKIQEVLKKIIFLDDNSELGIEINRVYDVYGLYFSEVGTQYFICEDTEDEYPTGGHACFFDIIDNSIPINWKFVYNNIDDSYLVPSEWAEDDMFYEKLLNGEKKEKIIFQKLKEVYTDNSEH